MAFLNYDGLKRYDKKTKEYIEDKIKKINNIDVDELATKAELDTKANKSDIFSGDYNDLTNKPTIPDTTNLATKSELKNHIDNSNIHVTSAEKSKWNAKLDNTALNGYATETYVTDEIAKAATGGTIDLSGYAKTVDVNTSLGTKVDKVTGKSLVDDTEIARLARVDNYDDTDIKRSINAKANTTDLTTHTSDTNIHITSAERTKWNNKAEMSDIPSLTNYATKAYVTDEIAKAATSGTVDLTGYAKTIEVDNKLASKADKTEIPDISNLATKGQLDSHTSDTDIHITSTERRLWNNKLDNTDLTNYATKTYVTDEIAKAATSGTVDLTGYAKTADVNAKLDTKVDKVDGKSLISDDEITRLSKISNYDDTDIKTNITNINSKLDTKANKSELFSKSYNDLTDKPTIPDISNLATQSYVTDEIAKASLSGTVDLSRYTTTDKAVTSIELVDAIPTGSTGTTTEKCLRLTFADGTTVVDVSVNDLVGSDEKQKTIVCIVDDDGTNRTSDAYTGMTTWLNDKGIPMNFAICHDTIGTSGKYTVTQLQELQAKGNDILIHGNPKLTTLADETEVITEIESALQFHTSNGLKPTNVYVYPQGLNSDGTLAATQVKEIVGRYFDYALNVNIASMSSEITKGLWNEVPLIDKLNIARMEVSSTKGLDANKSKIDACIENKGLLILFTHSFQSQFTSGGYDEFKKIINYLLTKDVEFLTVSKALDKIENIVTNYDDTQVKADIADLQSNKADKSHTHTKSQITDMPTKLSQFTNDAGFVTSTDIDTSQNHTHSNKTVLDKINQNSLDNWNDKLQTKKITTATDFDTLRETCVYYIKTSDCNNNPTNDWGTLFVSNEGTLYQIFVPDSSNSVYKRKWNSGSSPWDSWVDLRATDGDGNQINTTYAKTVDVDANLSNKVDKIDGKGLSTNDYTTEEKTKVSKIVTNGDGSKFLANDGTYKKVSSSTTAVAERKFKPSFCFDTYWGEIRDTQGNKNQVDLATIKTQIDQCEEMHVDKIICTVHIAWDERTKSLVIAENTDSLLTAISYCADKNVTIDTVKVHIQVKGTSTSENNYVNNVIGMSTFQLKYKAMLTTICNLFKNTTVTRITILNEMWYITNSSLGYSTFINECLNIVKNAGYTTGLTMAGFTSNQKLADAVIKNIDTFYINVYPGISGSGGYITKSEAIEAFNQSDVDLWIAKLKKDYPNKKIIISEMGTNDYWECLAAPSSWQVTGASKTGGYAVDTYITAMMEFFIRNNIDIEELWWWYDLYYAPVKETLLHYLGGDR